MSWTVRGSNPGGGEIFRTCPDRPWGPPSLLYNGYRVFLGGKERPGYDADPSPPSSPVVMNEQSYTSTSPLGRTACTEPQCLYKGALYLYTLYRNQIFFVCRYNKSGTQGLWCQDGSVGIETSPRPGRPTNCRGPISFRDKRFISAP